MKREIFFFLVELGQRLSKWAAQHLGDDILRDALTDDELNEIWPLEAEQWEPSECDLFNNPEILAHFRGDLIKQWGRY